MSAGFTFVPWVQRGLARSIRLADAPGTALASRITLPVGLQVEGVGDLTTTVRLYGPGDVTGLDRRQIARTDPRPGTSTFEAGYMPAIEFARADLPWLFTPAAPDGERLRPWLVLVVVRRRDGIRLDPRPGGPLPVLEIASPARAADELPDLSHSWAWAHGQITGVHAGQPPAALLEGGGASCSRLLCPRRLESDTQYLACLVPAFLVGVKAGLGEPIDPADDAVLAPAWEPQAADVKLPVYFSWEFATGPAGSFETLVRRLEPRPLDPDATRPPALDITRAGGGLPSFEATTPGGSIGLQSALRAPGDDALPEWPESTRVPLQHALERVVNAEHDGTIAAPAYGATQAGAEQLPAGTAGPMWLREVNLDPRLRVAAAAGARVVRDRQEQLMARAWVQAGAIRDANTLLRRTQVAREVGGALVTRHLQRMTPPELLAITQPVHARADLSGQTVDGALRTSRLPEAIVSGAMRRLASPQGAIARRAAAAPNQRRGPVNLLPAFARLAVRPTMAKPAGMVTGAMAAAAPPAVADRPAFSAQSVQARLMTRLRPEVTLLDAAKSQLAAPAGTWSRPDPLAPVSTGLQFPDPMYDGLRDQAPFTFLPGLDRVPPDSVALLETAPRVIEAFMIGLNHEMSRELLWREFPADLSGTPFRQFWDVRGQLGDPRSLEDIPPIADWGPTPLGTHLRGGAEGGQLVLLVRGELLRRYPATTIFAVRANPDGTIDAATRLAPMFRGFVDPDVVFLGFALTQEAALGVDPAGPGWYFGFEEHPGEPRFGFDERAETEAPTSADDLAWPHVPRSPSGHADLSRPITGASPALQAEWGRDAAGLAALAFQQPFRIAIHASRLIRPEVQP